MLFFEIPRIAILCRAKILLLENVPALLAARNRAAFTMIVGALNEAGYQAHAASGAQATHRHPGGDCGPGADATSKVRGGGCCG